MNSRTRIFHHPEQQSVPLAQAVCGSVSNAETTLHSSVSNAETTLHRCEPRGPSGIAIRGFALIFVIAFTVVGCQLAPSRSRGAAKIELDSGGALRVPVARSVRSIRTIATTRSTIPLDPEISGAHVYVIRPGDKHWSLVERTGPHGGPLLLTQAEGIYRVLVSDVQTHGILPGLGDIEGLRLHVDRTAPKLQLAARLNGDQWIVEYRIDDDLELTEAASLLVSSDGGQSWRKVYSTLGTRGQLGWRFDSRHSEHIHFSLTATDLAGNGGTLQRRLLDLDSELRPDIVGQAHASNPGTVGSSGRSDPADAVTAGARPDGRVIDGRVPGRTGITKAPDGDVANAQVVPAEFRTSAQGGSTAIDVRRLWGGILAQGLRVSGGGVLPLNGAWDHVFVETPDGVRLELERVGAHSVRLPELDGDNHHFVVQVGEREFRSVGVQFDSSPPRLTLVLAEPRAGGLLVRYRIEDAAVEQTRVSLSYRRGMGEWRDHPLPSAVVAARPVEQFVELSPGQYSFHLTARDPGGRRVETPVREDALSVMISSGGPRVTVAHGQIYRGGDRRLLFFDRVDPESILGDIDLTAVPFAGDEDPIAIWSIEPTASSRTWRVPAVDGEYRFQLSWHDPNGNARQWQSPITFQIDSTPPQLTWSDLQPTAGAFSATVASSEPIDNVDVWRRPVDADATPGEWQPMEDAVVDIGANSQSLTVQCSTGSWREQAWQLGLRGHDRIGNRLDVPVASPSFRVDRTAPEISTITIPSVMVEGIPWVVEGKTDSLPEMLTAEWTPKGMTPIEIPSTRRVDGDRVRFELRLTPGRGTLRLIASDESANLANRDATVEVLEAVEEIDIYPRVAVWAGLGAQLVYSVRSPYPRPGETLEMRLAGPDGDVVARYPLNSRQGRTRFEVPSEPGEYEVLIAIVGQKQSFRRGYRFVVQSQPRSADGKQDVSDMLVVFQQYQRRWTLGERGDAMSDLRDTLIERLQPVIERDPHRFQHRRALAALYYYCEVPVVERSLQILRDGYGATDNANLPFLYDDLSAFESFAGNYGAAEELLNAAIDVAETATRRANLGRVLVNAGNPVRAIAQFRLAMKIDPDSSALRRSWLDVILRLPARLKESELRLAVEQIGAWEASGRITREESIVLERKASEAATSGK